MIETKEVEDVIRDLAPKSSCGIDYISSKLFQPYFDRDARCWYLYKDIGLSLNIFIDIEFEYETPKSNFVQ